MAMNDPKNVAAEMAEKNLLVAYLDPLDDSESESQSTMVTKDTRAKIKREITMMADAQACES